ncbi:MAG: ABC transporter permease [Halopenitus sp.]
MNVRRRVFKRVAFAVIALYLVISLTFAVVVMTPDTNLRGELGTAAWAGASEEELAEIRSTYLEARDRDAPLADRYVDWLVDVTLFRWGLSPTQDEPVVAVVAGALRRTAAYLIPGVAAATVGGTALGLHSARRRGTVSDRAGRLGSYVLLGLPSFWLATLVVAFLADTGGPLATLRGETGLLWTVVAPAGIVAAGLVAGQVSLTRAHSVDHFGTNYVRFLRAKGLPEGAVSWRVLRNVVVPILSLLAAELFSVLVLTVVVVETVFSIEGIGWLMYVATENNDIPLILGTTVVFAVVGIGGSLIADLASAWLDPRVREGD